MNLSLLAIALQGIGFATLSVALQGFADDTIYPDFARRRRSVEQPTENDEALLLLIL